MTTNTSGSVTIFSGRAYLELTQTEENNDISRLVDTQRQVEISFYNTPGRSNSELSSAFKAVGMSKTVVPSSSQQKLQANSIEYTKTFLFSVMTQK